MSSITPMLATLKDLLSNDAVPALLGVLIGGGLTWLTGHLNRRHQSLQTLSDRRTEVYAELLTACQTYCSGAIGEDGMIDPALEAAALDRFATSVSMVLLVSDDEGVRDAATNLREVLRGDQRDWTDKRDEFIKAAGTELGRKLPSG